jgi:hypothetical protein
MLRREWKRGRLSMTPSQLLQRAQGDERFPRQTLGLAVVVASSITDRLRSQVGHSLPFAGGSFEALQLQWHARPGRHAVAIPAVL